MEFKKEDIMLDVTTCMGMIKIPESEIKGGMLHLGKLGNYNKISFEQLQIKVVEFENFDEEIVYHTNKTEVSKEFVDKAKDVCKAMGWDWDFSIFENEEQDNPMIFINGDEIGFVIAPRDRNWFKGKNISKAFKSLDDLNSAQSEPQLDSPNMDIKKAMKEQIDKDYDKEGSQ